MDIYVDGELLNGKTENLSQSGIAFWSASAIANHSQLRVTIPLTPLEHKTERTLTLKAKVRFQASTNFPQNGFKIGAEFEPLSDWQAEILAAILQSIKARKQFNLRACQNTAANITGNGLS